MEDHAHHMMNHGSMDHGNDTMDGSMITSTVASVLHSMAKAMNSSLVVKSQDGQESHHMMSGASAMDDPAMQHHNMGTNMPSHGSGSHMGMAMHEMKMYFNTDLETTVLFHEWKITTVGGLIASMFGIFLLAMLYEGLKFYREHLFKKYASAVHYSSVAVIGQDGKVVEEMHKIATNRIFSWPHAAQTLLHIVQVVISYFLMLIFMTYNIWLCLAVALGAGAGYFVFGWRKATVVDVTEHCH